MLEQLSCNAKLTGVVYDRKGKPIWRTESRRTVTESQWQLLIAKWGGCFHCGANPGICQGHHIEPASQGGPTKLDNLVPACWSCHHRIHHDNWWIHKRPDGWHTLHPPNRIHHGPARAPDHPPLLFKPDTQHGPGPPTPPPGPSPPRGEPGNPASPNHEPLFALA
ncbi:MAG: HNH endonuclease signature motif containing protein [Acidimicrobiaceae bacterium]|nr:HNH endonuclease signature motif containing protein [Acidimicrobiaceae bacterium]MDE0516859.1 HNH endonuclease signature motif containing protein [Acidimicrobiaceae bacterium]